MDTAAAESTEQKIYVIRYYEPATSFDLSCVILKAESSHDAYKKLEKEIGCHVAIFSMFEFTQEELNEGIYYI